VRNYIYYISKETFLLAFKAAYKYTFTKENAYIGFRGARLVLFNLDIVLLKPNIRLYTLTVTVNYSRHLKRAVQQP
jgi:hypothetical protein